MIHTYIADVTPLLEEAVYEAFYKKAPDWRKEKAARLRTAQGRAQSIGVWRLFEMACEEVGVDEQYPYNLSHSGTYVLCALSDKMNKKVKVGCDIEIIEELRINVAERFFTERENERIRAAKTEGERRDLFFRFWVLKESFMKATRLGMALDTRAFEIELPNYGNPILAYKPQEFSETYYYKEYEARGVEAKAAICTTEEIIAKELRIMELVNS